MHSEFPIMPVLVVAFAGFVIAGVIMSAVMARKRREELIQLAQRLKLNFDPGEDFSIPGRFGFLKQFNQGDNRFATNVLALVFSGRLAVGQSEHNLRRLGEIRARMPGYLFTQTA